MSDLFGAPSGQQAAIADMQRMAQTQGQQISNVQGAQKLQEQQRMAQIMQSMGDKGTPADRLEEASMTALKSGLVTSGATLAKDAADLRLKQAQTGWHNAQAFNQQATAAKTELALVDQLLGNVSDESSWRASNALFEQMTGHPSMYKNQPYSPELVDQIRRQSVRIKDQLDLQVKEYEAQTRRDNAKSNRDFRDFRKEYVQKNYNLRKQREDRLTKAGGSKADVGAPTKGELDRAEDIVKKKYSHLPDDELSDAGYAIAARARALRKTTPGLDADAAMERAMAEADANGEFKTTNELYVPSLPFLGGSTDTHFTSRSRAPATQGGKTPQTAIAVPANPAERQMNSYYTVNGKVYQWKGKGWAAVNTGPSTAAPVPESDDGDDDSAE